MFFMFFLKVFLVSDLFLLRFLFVVFWFLLVLVEEHGGFSVASYIDLFKAFQCFFFSLWICNSKMTYLAQPIWVKL